MRKIIYFLLLSFFLHSLFPQSTTDRLLSSKGWTQKQVEDAAKNNSTSKVSTTHVKYNSEESEKMLADPKKASRAKLKIIEGDLSWEISPEISNSSSGNSSSKRSSSTNSSSSSSSRSSSSSSTSTSNNTSSYNYTPQPTYYYNGKWYWTEADRNAAIRADQRREAEEAERRTNIATITQELIKTPISTRRPSASMPITNYKLNPQDESSNDLMISSRPPVSNSITSYKLEYSKEVEQIVQKNNVKNIAAAYYSELTVENIVNKANSILMSNAPWDEIYHSFNNKLRFATVLGVLNSKNGGKLPVYIGEVGGEYLFSDGKGDTYYYVAKNGSTIFYVDEVYMDDFRVFDIDGKIFGNSIKELQKSQVKVSAVFGGSIEELQKSQGKASINNNLTLNFYVLKRENYLGGSMKSLNIGEYGDMHSFGSAVKRSSSASIEGNTSIGPSGISAGVSAGAEIGSFEVNISDANVPLMSLKNDGSFSFNTIETRIAGSLTGGIKVGSKASFGKDSKVEAKAGLLGFSAGISVLDIDGAIKQIDPNVAINMISDYVEDPKSQFMTYKTEYEYIASGYGVPKPAIDNKKHQEKLDLIRNSLININNPSVKSTQSISSYKLSSVGHGHGGGR